MRSNRPPFLVFTRSKLERVAHGPGTWYLDHSNHFLSQNSSQTSHYCPIQVILVFLFMLQNCVCIYQQVLMD